MKSINNNRRYPAVRYFFQFTHVTVLAILGTALSIPAVAQVYQWKDADGKTFFSDSPPPGIKARAVSKSGGEPAQSQAPSPVTEKKADAKKTNPEKEKADKAAEEKRERALREYCDSAKNRLTELDSGMRLGGIDSKGERYVLTDEQRSTEASKLRQGMVESKCP